MTNASETVRDVYAEMCDDRDGEYFPFTAWEIKVTKKVRHLLKVLADRILSANEREMAAKDSRIALLERVLKPVMECDSVMASDGSISTKSACLCYSAIREAQRIMKEGENND